MNLRTKLTLFTNAILVLTILIIAAFSIYQYQQSFKYNIQEYRRESIDRILSQLKDIVNIAYSMIDYSYNLTSKESIEKALKISIQDTSFENIRFISMNLLKITLSNLRVLRFGVDGYLWINEFEPPYKVIMHGTRPELEGKSWVFYIEGTHKNVYEAFHDTIVAGKGAGRVSYDWYKPGTNEKIQKISWVRLYEPLGWVIGTGVYVDYIDKIVKEKEIQLKNQIQSLIFYFILLTSIFVILATIILTYFTRNITNPILTIKNILLKISKGQKVEKIDFRRKDEIGQMTDSLNNLIDGLHKYTEFAYEIAKENYQAKFEKLSDEDILGTALLQMRDSLHEARIKEQQRMIEDKRREWITIGINRIGDIITISPTAKSMAENIVLRIAEHSNVTAVALFFAIEIDISKTILKLFAAFAYNRQKFLEKIIEPGEGLIGSIYLEKKPMLITDAPEDYLILSSGLGQSKPRNIYISPLVFENECHGVLELASFKTFEEHEIKFFDEISKLIAISLTNKSKYPDLQ